MMQQQTGGAMMPPPAMLPQQLQQWPPAIVPPPQYYQVPPPQTMWNQQPSQIPPPAPVPVQAPPMLAPTQYQGYSAPPAVAHQPHQPASSDEIKTLWIGDLQYWMDETYVCGCFSQTGEVISVKLIRNKQTGQLEGYGFIEFVTRAAAERVLQTYTGAMMPNVDQTFRLNWASFGAGEKRGDDGNGYTLFVGDLAADVTDYILQETFKSHYSSVNGANVVTDRITGRPKGYGFVRFGDLNEQTRAMTEMNGMYCSSRPMRVGAATSKRSVSGQQQYSTKASYQSNYQSNQGAQSDSDPDNTTIFVGGLDTNVPEEELRRLFSTYGELVHVKIPMGKRCGFVQFANRACAEEALLMLNGTLVGLQNIRLSWGRSPNKQVQQHQQEPNQWNGNYYAYGYGQAAAQDPNTGAYGGFPGYPNYQQQPQ